MEELKQFIALCKQFPAQYTAEWFARIDSIGGSEIYDASQTPFSHAARKLGKSVPRASLNRAPLDGPLLPVEFDLGWGTLFEPLSCNYIAQRMNAPIFGRSVSYFSETFRFSPDGFFIDANGHPASLEMKNPSRRIPKDWSAEDNDKFELPHLMKSTKEAESSINPKYYAQIQLGMHIMPFLAYGLYVDCVYRRKGTYGACAVRMQTMRGVRGAKILDEGIIAFYHTSGAGTRESAHDFSERTEELDTILVRVVSELRAADPFIPLYFPKPDDGADLYHWRPVFKDITEVPLSYQGKPLFGFLPWQLLGIRAVRIARDAHFITQECVANIATITTFIRENMSKSRKGKIRALQALRENVAKISLPHQVRDIDEVIAELEAIHIADEKDDDVAPQAQVLCDIIAQYQASATSTTCATSVTSATDAVGAASATSATDATSTTRATSATSAAISTDAVGTTSATSATTSTDAVDTTSTTSATGATDAVGATSAASATDTVSAASATSVTDTVSATSAPSRDFATSAAKSSDISTQTPCEWICKKCSEPKTPKKPRAKKKVATLATTPVAPAVVIN